MGTINSYAFEAVQSISGADSLFGTDYVTGSARNFKIGDVSAFIIANYLDGDGNVDLTSFVQNPMIVDLNADGKKITNLADSVDSGDSVNRGELAEVYDFTNSRISLPGIATTEVNEAFSSVTYSNSRTYIKVINPVTLYEGYIPVYESVSTGSDI